MLHSRSRFVHFDLRKPRHPLVKLGFGLVGVALLSVLLVFGLFAGAAMLAAGVIWRLAVQLRSPQQQAVRGTAIDGEFRVVRKSDPMLSR